MQAMTKRLLTIVVDDDPSVRKALRRLLRSAQMDVETYASGDSFLATDLGAEPDCLILDVRMPGMSGPDLRKRLLAAGRDIAVVYITGYAEEEDELASGDTEILRKPFDGQGLLDAIHRAVGDGSRDIGPKANGGPQGRSVNQ
jgi:FixJ family two-component response regulator